MGGYVLQYEGKGQQVRVKRAGGWRSLGVPEQTLLPPHSDPHLLQYPEPGSGVLRGGGPVSLTT